MPVLDVAHLSFTDPRPSMSPEEQVVHGGLDRQLVRFLGVDFRHDAEIQYEIGGRISVGERFRLSEDALVRCLNISPHKDPLFIVLAAAADARSFQCHGDGHIESYENHVVCIVPPAANRRTVTVACARGGREIAHPFRPILDPPAARLAHKPTRRWDASTRFPLPANQHDHVLNLEGIPLPLENPYGRGVRAAAIDFFPDGRAALVTFDGDVWLCDGLWAGSTEVVWKRFTSGLHEPLSLRVREEEIFVFDRNGLWRLLDRDGNGEADYHELFCSRIDQTAETREFASALELETDGSFLVCKPGQHGTFSAILRISADGSDVRLVARGFRQPTLGYDPATGQIAASDQQGNWVPSTPVAFIKPGGFYGFPHGAADEDLPVTPPLTWLPHQECASAMSIVWMRNAKMGPLNDKPILLSYHPPRLFQVHTDVDEFATQGGATPLDLPIDSVPLLKAAVNPSDGLLYVTGFKIWGTQAEQATYLGRVRVNPDRNWTVPTLTRTARRGILLGFDVRLDPTIARNIESYGVRRWNYKRTSEYGSAHYRLDGETGTETLPVASVKLSQDGQSIFLGIPDMQEVMQIEVSYSLAIENGRPFQQQTFLTAHRLRNVNLPSRGFTDDDVDLRLKEMASGAKPIVQPTIERGARYYTQVGCAGCHSIDGSLEGKNGPSWRGLYGSQRKLAKTGELVNADEAYLRESILDPTAKVADGAIHGEAGMPIYAGVLNEEQIDSLVLFIKALADENSLAQSLGGARTALDSADHRWNVDDFREQLARPLRERSFQQGRLVFLGASCFACHQIGEGKGGRVGPDLAKLDEKMQGLELLTHILEPSRHVDDKFKSRTVATARGRVHQGFIVAEDETELHITPDPLTNRDMIVIRKVEIDEISLSDVSAMPQGSLNGFDEQQVLDLLAYIESRADARHSVFQLRLHGD